MYSARKILFIIIYGIVLQWDTTSGDDSSSLSINTTLTACYLVERGSDSLFYNFDRSAAAVALALDYVNEFTLSDIGTRVTQVVVDLGSTCDLKNHVVAKVMDVINGGVKCDVFIGPGCGPHMESLYDLASFYDTLAIGSPAAGVGISTDLSEFPLLTRISISHLVTCNVITKFLVSQNYTAVTFVQDRNSSFFEQLSSMVEKQLMTTSQPSLRELSFQSKFPLFVNPQLTKRPLQQQIETILTENSLRSRVFVLFARSPVVRDIMLTAKRLGMTNGEYVFICINLFPSSTWGNFSWRYGDEFDEDARDAFQTLVQLSIDVVKSSEFQTFANSVKTITKKRGIYNYADEVDLMTSHYYDSMIYYSELVKRAMRQNLNYRSGEVLSKMYQNLSFVSPVSGSVTVNTNGDRMSAYILRTFDPDNGLFGDYLTFGVDGSINRVGSLQWPSGNSFPPNRPYCGFRGEEPRCAYKTPQYVIDTAAAVPTVTILTAIIVASVLIRRRILSQSNPFWWRIFHHDLTRTFNSVSGATGSFKSKPSVAESVDKDAQTVVTTKTESSAFAGSVFQRAIYQGNNVLAKTLPPPLIRASRAMEASIAPIKRMQHSNIQKFYGIALTDDNYCEFVVAEFCSKGTLTRLIGLKNFDLDWPFQCSLIKDAAAGMHYLHQIAPYSHGNFSANTCLIDSNFVLKVCDYSLWYFRPDEELNPVSERDGEDRDFDALLWRAPELLRTHMQPQGTQKGDVYSYAIVLSQIVLRSGPFNLATRDQEQSRSREIVLEVKKGTVPPLRPRIPISATMPQLIDVIESCWEEEPAARPTFARIRDSLQRVMGKTGGNVVDHLIKSMERQAASLESEIAEKLRQFLDEKKRSDDILSQILPKSIAGSLLKGQLVYPETYESTTVQFSKVIGFHEVIQEIENAVEQVALLNNLYTAMDSVIDRFDVYKVETVNESHLIVSGLPVRNGIKHADEIASLALTLRREVANLKVASSTKLRLRVGIHSGPCVSGIVGRKLPKFCLFGDTINTAARMESHGEAGKIQCTATTRKMLETLGGFILIARGVVAVKGKGDMETFWIVGKDSI